MKKYLKALEAANNSDLIFEEAKKEASRQITHMENWMAYQQKYNSEAEEVNAPIFAWIRKARKVRQNEIYNVNAKINELQDEQDGAFYLPDEDERHAVVMRTAQEIVALKDAQYLATWRIMKIYCAIQSDVPLIVPSKDVLRLMEQGERQEEVFDEYEYDPEKS